MWSALSTGRVTLTTKKEKIHLKKQKTQTEKRGKCFSIINTHQPPCCPINSFFTHQSNVRCASWQMCWLSLVAASEFSPVFILQPLLPSVGKWEQKKVYFNPRKPQVDDIQLSFHGNTFLKVNKKEYKLRCYISYLHFLPWDTGWLKILPSNSIFRDKGDRAACGPLLFSASTTRCLTTSKCESHGWIPLGRLYTKYRMLAESAEPLSLGWNLLQPFRLHQICPSDTSGGRFLKVPNPPPPSEQFQWTPTSQDKCTVAGKNGSGMSFAHF